MRLRRGEHGGFGFAVTSGVDQQGDGEDLVRVEDVVVGGPADDDHGDNELCPGGEDGEDLVRVEDVVLGGPAEGKLKIGDVIVRIGGRELVHLQYEEAIQVKLLTIKTK